MTNKSPFFIVEELLSPLICEDIIQRLNNFLPDADIDGNPLKTVRYNKLTELRILPLIENIIPTLESYYSFELKGILPFKFEWFVEGFKVEPHRSESFKYSDKGWQQVNDVGFTGVIFLNDYNNQTPFDVDFEVNGGKLEFLTHKFGFNPTRGNLVFFPEVPNFINTTSSVRAGELNQIRFHVVPTQLYKYKIENFQGNYKTWFK